LCTVQLIIEPLSGLVLSLDVVEAGVDGLHLASQSGEGGCEAIHGALGNGSYYRH
jgi:hypothetical protein